MRFRIIATTALLGLCLILAWQTLTTRAERRQLSDETQRVMATTEQLTIKAGVLRREATQRAAETASRRQVALATLTAAERARGVVGPLVARIKAQHEIKPPAAETPPPTPPNGFYFLELMGDPKYNAAIKELQRLTAQRLYARKMRDAGLSDDQISRVLDLAAEREMVRWDYLSLAADPALKNDVNTQIQAKRAEIMAEIRHVVGDERFNQITNEYPSSIISMNADGTRSVSATTTRELATSFDSDRSIIQPIERRFSYAAEPLSEAQVTQLSKLVTRLKPIRFPLLQNSAFVEGVRSILSPDQQTGFDELKAEDDAIRKRSKLPQTAKSSGK